MITATPYNVAKTLEDWLKANLTHPLSTVSSGADVELLPPAWTLQLRETGDQKLSTDDRLPLHNGQSRKGLLVALQATITAYTTESIAVSAGDILLEMRDELLTLARFTNSIGINDYRKGLLFDDIDFSERRRLLILSILEESSQVLPGDNETIYNQTFHLNCSYTHEKEVP